MIGCRLEEEEIARFARSYNKQPENNNERGGEIGYVPGSRVQQGAEVIDALLITVAGARRASVVRPCPQWITANFERSAAAPLRATGRAERQPCPSDTPGIRSRLLQLKFAF